MLKSTADAINGNGKVLKGDWDALNVDGKVL